MKIFLCKLIIFTAFPFLRVHAQWERSIEILEPRENIYSFEETQFIETVMEGRRHALIYPVDISDLLMPYHPMKDFFDASPDDPVRKMLFQVAKVVSPFKSMRGLYRWLGLHDLPLRPQPETPNKLPVLSPAEAALPMGATLVHTTDGTGLTFGCAACHSADLFGVKVLGLTNRFPRANEIFKQGQETLPYVNSFLFKDLLGSTEGERKILVGAKKALKYVGTKNPVALGLDTSLAQVALSLSRRKQDEYASRTDLSHRFPRKNKLSKLVADSKPAVWWNLKYKNRWLSDGSIVSGNPIHTNFLWNEIGRGTDLQKLEHWMQENHRVIQSLTAAVFASRPPRYEQFFGVNAVDIAKARRGEAHYVQSCQKCHGTYEKGWSRPDAQNLNKVELIQNVRLTYHRQTPVKDVGTDPGRFLGMKEFAQDLNRLKISRSIGTVVEPQTGYVPPPLDGIWARWPYFHNNSVPNLCALLTPGPHRPETYWAGPARDRNRDFDQDCVGYPTGEKTPQEWIKNKDFFYDTRKEGLSRLGHDERIFLRGGKEIYSPTQKAELIEFLKTL